MADLIELLNVKKVTLFALEDLLLSALQDFFVLTGADFVELDFPFGMAFLGVAWLAVYVATFVLCHSRAEAFDDTTR